MSRTVDEKYIRDAATGVEELYDLATDPGEQENLGSRTTGRHVEDADSFLNEVRRTSKKEENVEIENDLEEQLRNLGYRE